MSRKSFVAGNWKMNTSLKEGLDLAADLAKEIGAIDTVDLAVCPPFTHLLGVKAALKGSKIHLGAQDMFYEDNGAYTGEISSQMLKDVGCRYVILGHSERRHVIGETDEVINRKIVKALADGLDVIFCVGELLTERQADQTLDVVRRQVTIGLEGVAKQMLAGVTVAYEPVWAIGTDETATPDQAQQVHAMIRDLIAQTYDAEAADALRIQYGGSVKPANAAGLLGQPDIDGALVGGASLTAADFADIVKAAP